MTSQSGGSFVPVIDVAYYQGAIDWERVKASGIAGAIIRASDGWRDGEDPRMDEYVAGAVAVGLPIGSYWYVRPVDDETAEEQAARFVGYVVEHDDAVRFLMLDVENYWRSDGTGTRISPDEFSVWLRRMIAELRRLGWAREIVIYTGAPFWASYVADAKLASEHDFVIARYPYNYSRPPSDPAEWLGWVLAQHRRPGIPAGASGWAGWQFTSSLFGPDVGIEKTAVDANLIRSEKWDRWTFVAPTPTPTPTPTPAKKPTPTPAKKPTTSKTVEVYTVNVTLPRLDTNTPKSGPLSVHVRAVQALLNAKQKTSLKIDGDFGPKTESAVRSWQAWHKLTVDGWIGAQTWSSLVEGPKVGA